MRIVFIADTFPPLRISGAVMMLDLVREFARQGHDPTVVVPTNPLDVPWRIERLDGVKVLRCRTPPTKDVGYLRRTINEIRLPHVLLRALQQSGLQGGRWDGVVWYSPTIFLGPMVSVLRRASRCRTYLILMDIFPKWALDIGLIRRGPVYYFFKMVEHGQYAVADTIGVQADASLPYFASWVRRPGRKTEVLQSWLADSNGTWCPLDIKATSLSGKIVFVYTGNMGVAQGLGIFLDVATRVSDSNEIGFLFVGRGTEGDQLATQARARGLTNVMFHDEIDSSAIPGLLLQCHVGIVALDPRLHTHNIPGKFLTYIRAGLPILGRINPGNELQGLVEGHRIGHVSTSNDAATLERMVRQLAFDTEGRRHMGTRARALFEARFSPVTPVRQIVAALSR